MKELAWDPTRRPKETLTDADGMKARLHIPEDAKPPIAIDLTVSDNSGNAGGRVYFNKTGEASGQMKLLGAQQSSVNFKAGGKSGIPVNPGDDWFVVVVDNEGDVHVEYSAGGAETGKKK